MSNLSRLAAVVGGLVLLGMLGLLGYVVAPYFVDADGTRRTAFIEDVARQLNAELPADVDESTRLERASVEDETLVYHYTLRPPLADRVASQTFVATYRTPVQQMVCSRQRLRALLDQDFRVAYRYRLGDGTSLGAVEVTREDCDA